MKQSLSLDEKNKAFLGFLAGARKAYGKWDKTVPVTLAKVERSSNALCFTILGNGDIKSFHHIPVQRILINGRWIDAVFRAYHAGEEAGDVAISWWKRNAYQGVSEVDLPEIDPDFLKWMENASPQA